MKKIILFICMAILISVQTNAQSYCTTNLYYSPCNGTDINDFSLANLHQTATGCSGELADYTSLTVNLAQGESYVFNATSTTTYAYNLANEYIGIWIDFNNNGSFEDAGEFVFASSTGGQLSGVLNIPVTATLGNHRMRVRLKNDYYGTFTFDNSCTTFYYGEAHDYSVNISAAPACPDISSLSVSGITVSSATINWGCGGCTGPFIIEYGLTGFTPGTGSSAGTGGTIINASSSPVTITGLNSSTGYDVYVRRNCDVNVYSVNLGPIPFTTPYDFCSTLTPITCGTLTTAVIPPGIGAINADGKELLYAFTPAVNGVYTLHISNINNGQAGFALKDASLGCNPEGWNFYIGAWVGTGTYILGTPDYEPNLDTLIAGHTYYLMIDSRGLTGATYTFEIDCYNPVNPCIDITTISCGSLQSAVIPRGLGMYTNYNDMGFAFGKEKIFKFTPQVTGIYTLTTPAGNSNGLDITLSSFKRVSDGCNSSGWHFINYEDNSYVSNTNLIGTMIAGVDYYLLFDATSLNGSTVNFQIDCYQPGNPCGNIATISCGTPVNFSVTPGAGQLHTPGCAGYTQPMIGKEKIYQFTPALSGYIVLQTSNFDGNWYNNVRYYIKEASLGCNNSNWQCFSDFNNYTYPGEKSPFPLTAGVTYYILADVDGLSGKSETFEITCPENWNPCNNSIAAISCSTNVTAVIPAGVGMNGGGKEIIFSFSPAISGTHLINIVNTVGSGHIGFSIWDASSGCNGSNSGMGLQLSAGHVYYIMLMASDYAGNTVTFNISCPQPSDPCGSISAIVCNTDYSVVNAPGLGLFDAYNAADIWAPHYPGRETIFSFTPSFTGNYQMEIVATNSGGYYPVAYFVKQATDGCNDNNWKLISDPYGYYYPGQTGNFPIALTAGSTYYIMADGETDGQTFRLICPTETYNPCLNITTITGCNTSVTTIHSAGLGSFQLGVNNYGTYSPCMGKENIFSFTPTQTGVYGMSVETGGTGSDVGYFIKEATSGCNGSTGWQYIGTVWSGSNETGFKLPITLTAGSTYYILSKPESTEGATQTFKINCPSANDPCNSITAINTCGYQYPIDVTLPADINPFNLVPCYGFVGTVDGGSKIYSFIPPVTGMYNLNVYNSYEVYFFVKDASLSCNADNWSCMNTNYNYGYFSSFPFLQGHTYYILAAYRFPYGSQTFTMYLNCTSGRVMYADADGDGYGNANVAKYEDILPVFGYVYDNTDCNDANPNVHPGATEICGNGIDDNCNGFIDEGCSCKTTVTIAASDAANSFCNGVELTANCPKQVKTYLWSTGAATQTILLTTADTAGNYSVTIHDVNGCTATATFSYNPQLYTSSFTLLGKQSIKLYQHNTVVNGSVGVVNSKGNANMGKYTSIAGTGAFLKAKNISLQSPYTIPNIIHSPANVPLPVMQYNTTNTRGLPNINVRNGTTITLNGNYKNITIGTNCNVTLTGSIFGNIAIGSKSDVLFTQSLVNAISIDMAEGTSNNPTHLRFSNDAIVRCSGNITVRKKSAINPENYKVIFYLGMANSSADFTVNGDNVTVNACMYIPNGNLNVDNSAENNFSGNIYMNGKFIAENIETSCKNVFWNWYDCKATNPLQPLTNFKLFVPVEQTVKSINTFSVKAWPNPSDNQFTLNVQTNSIEPVEIRVFDMIGRLVYSTKGTADKLYQFGNSFINGTYIAEVRQGANWSTVKLIKQ